MGCKTCCGYPHGRQSIYALLLSIAAYLLAISASWGCYYVKVDGFMLDMYPYFIPAGSSSGVGLWSYEDLTQDNTVCVAYNENQISYFLDKPWKAARGLAIAANSFIGISMILVICLSCMPFSDGALKGLGCCLLLGSLLEILTFVFFASKATDSPMNGSFFAGSGLALAGSLVALVTGLIVLRLPSAEDVFERSDAMAGGPPEAFAPGTETITETKLPDGTVKVTKTVVHSDGSRTVEETITTPVFKSDDEQVLE